MKCPTRYPDAQIPGPARWGARGALGARFFEKKDIHLKKNYSFEKNRKNEKSKNGVFPPKSSVPRWASDQDQNSEILRSETKKMRFEDASQILSVGIKNIAASYFARV